MFAKRVQHSDADDTDGHNWIMIFAIVHALLAELDDSFGIGKRMCAWLAHRHEWRDECARHTFAEQQSHSQYVRAALQTLH